MRVCEIKEFGIGRKSSAKIGRNLLYRRSYPNFTDPFRSLIFETRAKLNTCNNFVFSSEKEISRKKNESTQKEKRKQRGYNKYVKERLGQG